MPLCIVALGGNRDNSIDAMKKVCRVIQNEHGELLSSKIFLTPPLNVKTRDFFYNAAIAFQTNDSALTLLEKLENLEIQFEKRKSLDGSRTIDCDIIFLGKISINQPRLQIPHPEWNKRAFVLAPLLDLCQQKVLDLPCNIDSLVKSLEKMKCSCTPLTQGPFYETPKDLF